MAVAARNSMADQNGAEKSIEQGGPAIPPVSVRLEGKLYEDLEFISTTGDGVTFETKQGPLMAKWMELPEDIRKRFAKDYADSLREQQAAVMQDFGVARIMGPVLQKLPHGVIASWLGQPVMLTGHPGESSLTKGEEIDVTVQRTGSFPYTDDSGKTKIIRRFKVLSVH